MLPSKGILLFYQCLVCCTETLNFLDRGQGLNNAIQDAAELMGAIGAVVSGASSLNDAVTAYEVSMRPRGARDVALSSETAKKCRIEDVLSGPMFKVGLNKVNGQDADER